MGHSTEMIAAVLAYVYQIRYAHKHLDNNLMALSWKYYDFKKLLS